MCEKKYLKQGYCNPRIDDCLKEAIELLNYQGYKTLASCCGHNKYPTTIVVKHNNKIYEIDSGIELGKRKRNRYYKKDNEGYYYIPEVGGLV
jgi:hypothetical protein